MSTAASMKRWFCRTLTSLVIFFLSEITSRLTEGLPDICYIQQTAGHTYKCTTCGLIHAIKRQSPAPSCVHHGTFVLERMCTWVLRQKSARILKVSMFPVLFFTSWTGWIVVEIVEINKHDVCNSWLNTNRIVFYVFLSIFSSEIMSHSQIMNMCYWVHFLISHIFSSRGFTICTSWDVTNISRSSEQLWNNSLNALKLFITATLSRSFLLYRISPESVTDLCPVSYLLHVVRGQSVAHAALCVSLVFRRWVLLIIDAASVVCCWKTRFINAPCSQRPVCSLVLFLRREKILRWLQL